MLRSADISVVLAGPMSDHTPRAIGAVRSVLPDAELIVSSWRGTVPTGLDADVVVENDDPGSPSGLNTNRMFRSARQGLERASRSHAMKLRTDAILDGRGFADWWEFDPPRAHACLVFARRIVTINIATRPSGRRPGQLFHPSDCVHFGRTEDVQRLWAAPEIDELGNLEHRDCQHRHNARGPRLANEQALWIGCLRGAGYRADWCSATESSPPLRAESDLGLVNNFVVLEPWQFGVQLPKLRHEVMSIGAVSIRMWLTDWRRAYERLPLGGEAGAA